MSEETQKPKKLSLSGSGKLSLGSNVDQSALRGNAVGAGRGKTVQVEVRRKRNPLRAAQPAQAEPAQTAAPAPQPSAQPADDKLTAAERANRIKVLQEGLAQPEEEVAADQASEQAAEVVEAPTQEPQAETAAPEPELSDYEKRRQAELAELQEIEAQQQAKRQSETERLAAENASRQAAFKAKQKDINETAPLPACEDGPVRSKRKAVEVDVPRNQTAQDVRVSRRRTGKMTISQALSDGDGRQRSLASVRRQREKQRMQEQTPAVKQIRDVVIPDSITVQELANRMAERSADVVKELMKLGIMVTATQSIDAETAELVTIEFGHKVQRVSESDVEDGLGDTPDPEDKLLPRPPVVTVMGMIMVRPACLMLSAQQMKRESGGITQHIGAYQIKTGSGNTITFIDTPGMKRSQKCVHAGLQPLILWCWLLPLMIL